MLDESIARHLTALVISWFLLVHHTSIPFKGLKGCIPRATMNFVCSSRAPQYSKPKAVGAVEQGTGNLPPVPPSPRSSWLGEALFHAHWSQKLCDVTMASLPALGLSRSEALIGKMFSFVHHAPPPPPESPTEEIQKHG